MSGSKPVIKAKVDMLIMIAQLKMFHCIFVLKIVSYIFFNLI